MDSPGQTIEENMKWLEYIKKEAVRMTKMTEDLLLLSSAGAKGEAIKEEIDLSGLISGVYDSFKPLFAENNLIAGGADIERDIYIRANENGIRQLLTIFLDNAVKYTKEGGSISVSLEKDGHKQVACIKVTDTGIGMPAETVGKIFERFFRIDKARSKSTGGAGLGLSIAKVITDEHGGEITVKSEQDKGSEFCVKLPL
jgi:two-component system phosphate regulon sensor histidine kinase PhoR